MAFVAALAAFLVLLVPDESDPPLAHLSEDGLRSKAVRLGTRGMDLLIRHQKNNETQAAALKTYREEHVPGLLEVFDELVRRGFAEEDQRRHVERPEDYMTAMSVTRWFRQLGDTSDT